MPPPFFLFSIPFAAADPVSVKIVVMFGQGDETKDRTRG